MSHSISILAEAKLSKSAREKLQFKAQSEVDNKHDQDQRQNGFDGLPGDHEYDVDLSDQESYHDYQEEEEDNNSVGIFDWLHNFKMGEDLADKVDDFICAWDKVVGTDLDTLVVLILGWLGFGGIIFTVSHIVYSTIGPGEATSLPPPSSIPPFKSDGGGLTSPKGPPSLTPVSPLEVSAQIPSQPPPTSEFGVVGSDPGAVQYITLCLQYLHSHQTFCQEMINLWIQNLNEFTMKTAIEDGMLVEFADIVDKDKLAPTVSNMTVEAMPNDNLLLSGELTMNVTFTVKISRPMKDEMLVNEYTLHLDRVRGRFSVTFINNEDLAIAKFEGWPDIKARLAPVDVPVQSLSREELNLCEVVEDVSLSAVRRVQCDIKPSTVPNFPVFVKTDTKETSNSRKKMNPAFGQNPLIQSGVNNIGSLDTGHRLLDVTVVKAVQLGGLKGLCLEPYVVLEIDDPSQKHQTRTGSGAQYSWNDTFSIEITKNSCEILFEVWDQGQKIGKSDAFMGLAIVSVTELLATASQRHVVPLQGRPYEEDQVTGLLTVEFLFKLGAGGAGQQGVGADTAPTSDALGGASHNHYKTVINKPLGGIMKPPVSFQDSAVNGDSSLTRSESYKASINNSNSSKKPFTPYFDYNTTYTGQDLLKPPSRSSSKNRRTAFAEPLETSCDPVDTMPHQLSEIANCENPVSSSSQNINGGDDAGSFTRGRKRTRTFFNTIKRKLSATRSQSSVMQSRASDQLNGIRSASENRPDTSLPNNRPVSWMSDTSSISGLSGISNISNRTFVCEESSLVLEVLETDRHHYYLVPIQTAKRGKFKKKGNKLHIYMDHTFVAQHIKLGSQCEVCRRSISMRPGKQGYICRDCGMITHKPCHIKVESHCLQTTVPSLDLEYYGDEKK